MTTLKQLIDYCDNFLNTQQIADYCPNGLQVAAHSDATAIKTIVTGVTANLALIEQAIAQKAQLLLVHHGYFWRGESQPLIGMKGKRIRQLMQHNLSMAAYHLPLDVHNEIGNNVLWGKALGLQSQFISEDGLLHGCRLQQPLDCQQLLQRIQQSTQQKPLHLPAYKNQIQTIYWCTGAAQDYLAKAAALGADAFLSGEVSERTSHEAAELGVHYFRCGHHASETFGIQALGEHLAKRFNLNHQFINIVNPV